MNEKRVKERRKERVRGSERGRKREWGEVKGRERESEGKWKGEREGREVKGRERDTNHSGKERQPFICHHLETKRTHQSLKLKNSQKIGKTMRIVLWQKKCCRSCRVRLQKLISNLCLQATLPILQDYAFLDSHPGNPDQTSLQGDSICLCLI